ncbi:TetR/AcrR family transcriptional regulator [Kitasatospora sp. SUK 42]|uniref:TetR/AcrR family transcriptional regulator n=1 Tax=Kitasatospora sp. SUK 42 TaxID=1588882 RepID=UPI001C312D89|nr:TetR family transcriptional regulator [Kitasatospora sp. SUK 42]MBV2156574.1 TetR family transcriptional regulator [Kitasatospora sp. SUK 42]
MVSEDGMRAPYKKHSGRRAGPVSSQRQILEAAREEFCASGFEGTTMRAIAQSAGVDAALIHHFFLSKGGLFTAAIQDVLTVPDLVAVVTDGRPETMGDRLAAAYVSHWEDPEIRPRLVALLRSATSFEGATDTIREFLADTLQPVAAAAGRGRADLRASLCGSFLLGIAALRYVNRIEPTASMAPQDLVRTVAGACQSYLYERL